jgi:chromosome segregation ATPase
MTLNDAVAALKAHARQLEAVQVIAAAISDVSAIEQLTDEAEQRRVARQAEVNAAHARLVDAEGALKAAQEKVLASNAKAVALIEDAKLKAASIIEAAKADAVSEAEKAAANATANLKRLTADVDKTHGQLTQMLASLDDLNASFTAKSAELTEVEKRIAAAKALMSGFVG